MVLLAGCDRELNQTSLLPTQQLTRTLLPTPTLFSKATDSVSSPDTGWVSSQTGFEQRVITLFNDGGEKVDSLIVLRFDPDFFRFDVAYSPGEPKSLPAWQAETGAFAVVNGGFFTPEFIATGRIVVAGIGSGTSYGDNAGMFLISANSTPEIRSLTQQPYDLEEAINAGIQAFPMLVLPGGIRGHSDRGGQPARRTVIAQDRQGRIIFLISMWPHFTLAELSNYLMQSGLELDVALNLDGGSSSGVVLATGEGVASFTGMPAVIVVYEKNN